MMAKGKYTRKIEQFCRARGFEIPIGFYRRTANHLAVFNLELTPPRLIAATWFKKEDVVYYIENLLKRKPDAETIPQILIYDFKNDVELEYRGGKRLSKKSG